MIIRTAAAFFALGLTLPAVVSAQTIVVHVDGKTEGAARLAISAAAEKVCAEAGFDPLTYESESDCVARAAENGFRQLRKLHRQMTVARASK